MTLTTDLYFYVEIDHAWPLIYTPSLCFIDVVVNCINALVSQIWGFREQI